MSGEHATCSWEGMRLQTVALSLVVALATACGSAQGTIEDLNGGSDPNGNGTNNGTDPTGVPNSGTNPTGTGDGGGAAVGKGTANPFNPKGDGSSGVKLDPEGNIVIDPSGYAGGSSPVIWVANSAEGTVSKIDTRTLKEIARYRTGPGSPDPSRTTVSLNGDVVVVNRGGASATKIASNPLECTGAGTGTSSGAGDVRAWGDDKCVLWNTPFDAGSLGRAAAFDAEKGLDGELSTSVWVGLWTKSEMLQLDSKTGAIKATVNVAPLKPYGAAIDANHNVWVWGGGVGYINGLTKTFTQIASPPCAYGIAVDPKGRVWTSGSNCVARYTPDTAKWDSVSVTGFNRGLAVDAKGSVWVASTSFGVHQLDMESMAVVKSIPLGASKNFVGMAIDFDGMIWSINQAESTAYKIDPATYAVTSVASGKGPYTYSDMTGFQLRNAANPFGKYQHLFKGCGATARWLKVDWKAITPSGTQITVRARAGKDIASVKAAAWVLVAKVPGDVPPIDVAAKLGEAGKGEYLEVEFRLESITMATTPILSSIDVLSTCPPAIN
jgi:glutamine cyclotransferase